MEDIIARILSLIDNSGKTDTEILRALDVSNSSTLITDWRKGRSKSPQIKHILKLANYFQVSTDFLLTGKINSTDLCESEKELIRLFRSLPEQTKGKAIGYIEGQLDAINQHP